MVVHQDLETLHKIIRTLMTRMPLNMKLQVLGVVLFTMLCYNVIIKEAERLNLYFSLVSTNKKGRIDG